jgi:membrane associated rhomboid family serine protease
MLFPVLIVLAIVVFVMPHRQRQRLLETAQLLVQRSRQTATRHDTDDERFKAALRAREPRVPVTLAIIAITAVIYLLMATTGGVDANKLMAWGGSVGPRTTNGEWWRLITAIALHAGLLHTAVNIAVILQLGLILERLVGRAAFAGLYVAAGVVANLITMSSYRVIITVGASGAICGLYGLLLATTVWGLQQRPGIVVPPSRMKKIGVLAAAFIVCNAANGAVSLAGEITALLIGFACGIVLTRGVHVETPPLRLVGATLAVAAGLAVALALPLRGIADVRPEIATVLAVEGRTAQAYEAAADRFKKGHMTADALAQLIVQTIVPQLQAADARIQGLTNVPPEMQPLVEHAEEYLRLRTLSWRLRADGLRKTDDTPRRIDGAAEPGSNARWRVRAEAQYRANLNTLANADSAERRSLEALQRIK